ncbi:SDR family NAD(P)-dependent oxidoreductase [Knoellia sp. CPCC 206435]|uniref:SDR family NAD(P)-dependent oxidoreductase n=1 Tax=Knoellia terrae TaxID=3404797 RepID=UPI003B42E1A6
MTGGGRGLGRAIALELGGRGAAVVVNDLFVHEDGTPAAQRVAAEIVAAGGQALADTHDISDFDAAAHLVGAAVEAFRRLDILVTPAGNYRPSSILDLEEDEWDSVTGVHLGGHVACMRAAARQMIVQGDGGRIVTVSSRGGLFGTQVAYSGAKAAIMGLTSAAARELAEHGITVNCLLPSAMTQLFSIPAGNRRFGGMPETLHMEPEHIAPLVAYLVSPAAAEVTGQFLYSAGTDICAYAPPLQLAGVTTFARHTRGWTVEELAEYVPGILGLDRET